MGFDNECILNIQSLAGEYFCPVCRMLVYPKEALQSQCTHLYCKPCLTYVVSTTRACPYDGYLVTEAYSKPLIESNKSLAETIGKIAVHCLYHRSGCTWQGSLSDCTSHCSSCAFGNSPVVCNRCGIQIVHRQIQEHALSCAGVQPQAQAQGAAATSATSIAATSHQTPSATPAVTVTSQAQPSQSMVTAQGKELNQQSNSSSQAQTAVQATIPTSEQWYQQQLQYQQYYQQYPGYDQYQQQYQQYYAQQQQHVPAHASNAATQHQPLVYTQPQPQLLPQTQSQPQPQASFAEVPVATQPQNQAQINSQQQVQPVLPQHSQVQPQTYVAAQPYTQPQLHQPHPQPIQYQQAHRQPHIQQQIQTQVQPHHPSQPNLLPQAQPLGQLQPRLQHNKHPNANVQSQSQNPTAHAVSGHNSYPQPNTEPSMHTGVPQQYPVQVQSQFPQQPLLMRPSQSQATIPSQQQPTLLPPRGQVPNMPPAQQLVQQPYFQQPGQPVHLRPGMQTVQQTFPQQHFQQQQSIPSQLRPQAHSQLFPPQTQNVASSLGTQNATSPNLVGRASMPSQGVPSQPHPHYAAGLIRPTHHGLNQQSPNQNNILKTSNQMHFPSEHSGANSKLTVPAKTGATDLDSKPVVAANTGAGKETEKSNIDVKPVVYGNKFTNEDNADLASKTSREFKNSAMAQGEENGETMVKPIMTEGDQETTLAHSGEVITEDKKDVLKEDPEKIKHLTPTVENKTTVDGSRQKNPSLQALEHHEGQVGNLVKDGVSGSIKGSQGVSIASAQIHGSPAQSITARGTAPGGEVNSSHQHGLQAAGVQEYGGFPQISQAQAGGFIEPHPIPDPGKHRPLPSHYGPPTFPQKPGASPLGPSHQTSGLGPPQTQFGPQVPGRPLHPPGGILDPSATSFGREPSQYGHAQQGSELQPVAPQGPYNPVHSGALPAFESHGGMIAREPPHGPEVFPNQRPNYMDGRWLDPNFPGSLEHGPLPEPSGMHPNLKRMNGDLGLDSASTIGPRNDRLPLQAERFNSFPAGPDRHVSIRAEFEDDLKKFPRPFDRGPHEPRYDNRLKLESGAGSIPSRFLSPYDGGLSDYLGERPGGRHEDAFGRREPTHGGHPEFFGPGPSFGRHHMDRFGSRSPGLEHSGIYSHGFEGPRPEGIHGRELRRYAEPFPFPENRFSVLPSHLRRGEFQGPGNMGMGDHLRSDFIGQDGFSSHLHRGEHGGNLYSHLHLREQVGFGAHPRHARMREIGGPGSLDLFGGGDRPGYLHLGEPGFRSSYSRHRPDEGELAFDKSKKRKQPSMGWCRICKVDCETVEGLELHSQTREHQKMAMDIVLTIKQNAKKKKLTSGDQSLLGDASNSKKGGSEDRGKKN